MLAISFIALFAIAGASEDEQPKLPASAEDILLNAKEIELFSLDPGNFLKDRDPTGFHGYTILGQTTIKEKKRQELVANLQKSLKGKVDPKLCFYPRHAIRAVHDGKTADFVICFECGYLHVYSEGGPEPTRLVINKSGEPAFDRALKAAKIPKAK